MSLLVPTGIPPFKGRFPYDQYATTKSGGNFLLTAGLIADDIKELIAVIYVGEAASNYYAVLVLIFITMGLEIICLVLSLVLLVQDSRRQADDSVPTSPATSTDNLDTHMDKQDPEVKIHMQRINDTLTVVSIMLALMHIIRCAVASSSSLVVPPTEEAIPENEAYHRGDPMP